MRRHRRTRSPAPARASRIVAPARCVAEALESRLLLSTYTVTSTSDSGPVSLRDAIDNRLLGTITPDNPNLAAPDFLLDFT